MCWDQSFRGAGRLSGNGRAKLAAGAAPALMACWALFAGRWVFTPRGAGAGCPRKCFRSQEARVLASPRPGQSFPQGQLIFTTGSQLRCHLLRAFPGQHMQGNFLQHHSPIPFCCLQNVYFSEITVSLLSSLLPRQDLAFSPLCPQH